MKTARATLSGAIILMLSLMTSVAFGAARPIEDYQASSNGFYPETGILKASDDCPMGTTFIKNAFPSLTNGQGGSTVPRQETYLIGMGSVTMPVTVQISWLGDNSFGFDILNGVAHIVGVTSDTNNLLYDYVNYYTDVNNVTPPPPTVVNEPVTSDGGLNAIVDAADVNHLDFCLAAVDNVAPEVRITSPINGAAVTGLVTVTAEVTENVQVDTVMATVTDGLNYEVQFPLTLSPTPTQPPTYQGTWDTTSPTPLTNGLYTITVVATDTSGNETPPAQSVNVIDVSVVTPALACEGLLGPDDPSQNEGCNPSGVQNVQVPPDNNLANCVSNDPQQPLCTITEFLLTPDPAKLLANVPPSLLAVCTGPNVFPDPRVGADGIPLSPPLPDNTLDVFAVLGGGTPGELILDEYTFGNPCFAVVKGARNFDLLNGFFWPDDPATGLVIIRTQFSELVPGIGSVVQCYDETANPNLMQVAEATYQDDDKTRMKAGTAEVMTNACFNPKRMSSFDFSFNVLNTKEYGVGIDFNAATGPDDVLEFKFQRADAKFDFLEQALFAAESQLVSPRFSVLTRKFNQARSQFDKRNTGALTRAIDDLGDLLFEVRNGTWDLTPENNPGDVQMRTENLIHRIELIRREVIRLETP